MASILPSTKRRIQLFMLRALYDYLPRKRTIVRARRCGGGFWSQSRKRKLVLLATIRLALAEVQENKVVRRPRRWGVRPIYAERWEKGAWYTIIPRIKQNDPEKFFEFFRMTPALFDELLELLEPSLQKRSFAEHISAGERLAITLRFLASGGLMRSISFLFLVSPPTISNIIRETCRSIWNVLGPRVFPPLTAQKWEEVADEYGKIWNFPNCVGAIDGKHCTVQAFPNSGSLFHNYKGTHSLVLLGLCDAKYRFLMVDIGAKGRQSDGGVLKNSAFGQQLAQGKLNFPPPKCLPGSDVEAPFVIVGDEAFPLQEHIMRPYPGTFLPDEQIIYNYRVSRARRVIENSFGILSARWRILRKTFIASHASANAIVRATVCLHNMLVLNEENVRPGERVYIPPRFVDSYDPDGSLVPGQWRNDGQGCLQGLRGNIRIGTRNPGAQAVRIRQIFADYFMGVGQVSWQWKKLPTCR